MEAFTKAVVSIPTPAAVIAGRSVIRGASVEAAVLIEAIVEKLNQAKAENWTHLDNEVTHTFPNKNGEISEAAERAVWAFRHSGYRYSHTTLRGVSTITVGW